MLKFIYVKYSVLDIQFEDFLGAEKAKNILNKIFFKFIFT